MERKAVPSTVAQSIGVRVQAKPKSIDTAFLHLPSTWTPAHLLNVVIPFRVGLSSLTFTFHPVCPPWTRIPTLMPKQPVWDTSELSVLSKCTSFEQNSCLNCSPYEDALGPLLLPLLSPACPLPHRVPNAQPSTVAGTLISRARCSAVLRSTWPQCCPNAPSFGLLAD